MDPEIKQFFEELTQKAKADKKNSLDFPPPVMLGQDGVAEFAKTGAARGGKELAIKTRNESGEVPGFDNSVFDGTEGTLTVDVYQTPDEIVVESTIAGARPEDLDINITKNTVTIRGMRHREKKIHEDNFLYQECYWGRFSRTVVLSQEVDPDEAEATLRNGILRIVIPKLGKNKTKKLKVRS